ncbi:MAG: cell surface protein, partial [Methanosarcinaceae archaeon]|nr:cell surface protein [Methanosarcinaceae archaeon]
SLNVTAEVSDSSAGAELFSKGLLLDSLLWSEYSKAIGSGNQTGTAVALRVPAGYSELGHKKGTITFWAEAVE